ncbi:hypothetical protein ZOSMA_87G01040 [Zostera marina]|uniref:Uncharacterized protein n=1 Tax=Zostera marina TaxID=29655 RepID=A0A0K9NMQ1_ZOSMR|nr:hypothetical protein ZOSMA_87G01040 [Zostera marina]
MEERYYIDCDIFMTDNQIPLFIIGDIWKLLETAGVLDIEDRNRCIEFVNLDGIQNGASTTLLDGRHSRIANVVPTPTDDDDLVDGDDNLVRVNDSLIWIPSVSQLEKVGVKFDSNPSDSYLEIKFNEGVLEIPSIFLQPSWKYYLVNRIKYEISYYDPSEQRIIGVVRFMCHLLKTTEDVRILWESRTIDSEQGSAEDRYSKILSTHKQNGRGQSISV